MAPHLKHFSNPVNCTMLALILCMATASSAIGQHHEYFIHNGLAIRGYDPVAYFTKQEPVKGSSQYTTEWKGATWQFSSDENLRLFTDNPEKYAPQYGGWCAFGVSENHKSPTDPMAWTVVDGKLYLNYSPKVKQLWLKDTTQRIGQADAYWKNLKKE